jgi:hypothetical protein
VGVLVEVGWGVEVGIGVGVEIDVFVLGGGVGELVGDAVVGTGEGSEVALSLVED